VRLMPDDGELPAEDVVEARVKPFWDGCVAIRVELAGQTRHCLAVGEDIEPVGTGVVDGLHARVRELNVAHSRERRLVEIAKRKMRIPADIGKEWLNSYIRR